METPVPGEPFILFCLARTGSTSIAKALNMHPAIRCVIEPFNERNFEGRYAAAVTDERSLFVTVAALRSRFNGIKHVWHPSGWPFGNGTHLNRCLATMEDQKVIFLTRRNVLRRLVSSLISEQLQVWHLRSPEDRRHFAAFSFAELDIEWIQRHLADEEEQVQACLDEISSSTSHILPLSYEDVFVERSRCEPPAAIFNVLRFLGVETPEELALQRMAALFDDPYAKVNSTDSYLRIPNIDDIESRCGSDRTGWLLR